MAHTNNVKAMERPEPITGLNTISQWPGWCVVYSYTMPDGYSTIDRENFETWREAANSIVEACESTLANLQFDPIQNASAGIESLTEKSLAVIEFFRQDATECGEYDCDLSYDEVKAELRLMRSASIVN